MKTHKRLLSITLCIITCTFGPVFAHTDKELEQASAAICLNIHKEATQAKESFQKFAEHFGKVTYKTLGDSFYNQMTETLQERGTPTVETKTQLHQPDSSELKQLLVLSQKARKDFNEFCEMLDKYKLGLQAADKQYQSSTEKPLYLATKVDELQTQDQKLRQQANAAIAQLSIKLTALSEQLQDTSKHEASIGKNIAEISPLLAQIGAYPHFVVTRYPMPNIK